jgi:hypothetical protein
MGRSVRIEPVPLAVGYDESVKSDDNERLDFGRGP